MKISTPDKRNCTSPWQISHRTVNPQNTRQGTFPILSIIFSHATSICFATTVLRIFLPRPIKQTFRLKLSKCGDTNKYYSIKLKLKLFSSCIYSEQIKLNFIPWRNSLCKVKPSKSCWWISQRYVTVFYQESFEEFLVLSWQTILCAILELIFHY